jgi:hypothetical protein
MLKDMNEFFSSGDKWKAPEWIENLFKLFGLQQGMDYEAVKKLFKFEEGATSWFKEPPWMEPFLKGIDRFLEGGSDWIKAWTKWFLYGPSGNAPLLSGPGGGGTGTGEPGGSGIDVPTPEGLPRTPRPRGTGPSPFTDRFGKWRTEHGGTQPIPEGSSPPIAPGSREPVPGSSEYLRNERMGYADELADPNFRMQMAALVSLENEGAGTAVVESAMNRASYTGKSLRDRIFARDRSGRTFYGPINRGLLAPRMRQLANQPERLKKLNAMIDRAIGGSNVTEGATDQGSGNDPNVNWPGGRKKINGEIFNDWGGGPGGHEGARRFRERQQQGVRQFGEMPDTSAMDRSLFYQSGIMGKIEGGADININVNAPRGTSVDAQSRGIFKETTINRQQQMGIANEASDGPDTFDARWRGTQ